MRSKCLVAIVLEGDSLLLGGSHGWAAADEMAEQGRAIEVAEQDLRAWCYMKSISRLDRSSRQLGGTMQVQIKCLIGLGTSGSKEANRRCRLADWQRGRGRLGWVGLVGRVSVRCKCKCK